MSFEHTPFPSSAAWWTLSSEEILQKLQSTTNGLTSVQAEHLLQREGKNNLQTQHARSPWNILVHQFTSPLVGVLVGASIVSGFLGEITSTIIIIAVTLLGALLAFIQENRSERVIEQLQRRLSRRCLVLRDGKKQDLDAEQLVMGDIVFLEAGNITPADLRLLETNDLEIDESNLTGESLPVPKSTAIVPDQNALAQEQSNIIFSGTPVIEGTCTGIVIATGAHTEMGRIASSLTVEQEETEFQKGVRAFGNFLLKITLGLTVIVFCVLLLHKGGWIETLIFSLALAIGISPELLPLIVTINLSNGALAMSKKHVLVKRLIAIEDLGNVDVMCTDKTGTLTVGTLRIREGIDPTGQSSMLPLSYALHCISTDSDRARNPIDAAIAEIGAREHLPLALPNTGCVDTIAFDFARRRMSCVVESKQERTLICKGAVNEVLAVCTFFRLPDEQSAPLSDEERTRLLVLADHYHDQGARLLAVAISPIAVKKAYDTHDERDLEFIGFIVASDAPKATAAISIERMVKLGVRLVILTGDNERVTAYVAQKLHFPLQGILTGDAVEKLSDDELAHQVMHVNVFARITPEHKLRIIQALKKNSLTVGFMGDGINDAPALRQADVGISFEEATDVAREAADVILLQRGLEVVNDGIIEGRKTFTRTMTYLYATISSNFGNMLSVAGAAVLLPFIPLLPSQILFLNLISDIPMLAIPTDHVEDEQLKRPHHWNIRAISNSMYFFGIISSLADYATFAILLFMTHGDIVVFRTGWFIESLCTEIAVIFLLRVRGRLRLKNLPSKPLFIASFASLAVGVAIAQSSTVGRYFGFSPLSLKLLFPILGVVVGYMIVTEIGKKIYNQYFQTV